MARGRDRLIRSYPVLEGAKEEDVSALRVEVSYRMGGTNFFRGGWDPRGYVVEAGIYTHRDGMTPHCPTDCVYKFLVEAKAFSPKKLASIVPSDEDIQAVVKYVLARPAHKDVKLGEPVNM